MLLFLDLRSLVLDLFKLFPALLVLLLILLFMKLHFLIILLLGGFDFHGQSFFHLFLHLLQLFLGLNDPLLSLALLLLELLMLLALLGCTFEVCRLVHRLNLADFSVMLLLSLSLLPLALFLRVFLHFDLWAALVLLLGRLLKFFGDLLSIFGTFKLFFLPLLLSLILFLLFFALLFQFFVFGFLFGFLLCLFLFFLLLLLLFFLFLFFLLLLLRFLFIFFLFIFPCRFFGLLANAFCYLADASHDATA